MGVTDRRDQILDAAIAVLAGHGVRGVTHRAVDVRAGLPAGSTSNYFRSRDALFEGVVERVVTRERAAFEEMAAAARPATPRELVDLLAAWARTAVGERREVTAARFALLVEAATRPALGRVLAAGAGQVDAWARHWLTAVGSAHPDRDFQVLGGLVEAMTLHQLAYPDPAFDPAPLLRELVELLADTGAEVGAGR